MTLSLRMTATVSIVQSVRPGESSPKASESSDSEESKELMTIGTSNHYTSHSSGVTTTTVAVVNQVMATLGNYMYSWIQDAVELHLVNKLILA